MRRMAVCTSLAFAVLGVAPPDDSPVFAVGIPHLAAVQISTLTADDSACENITGTVGLCQWPSAFPFVLYQVKYFRRNDAFMTARDIVLCDFALVDFLLFGEVIDGVLLLQKGISFVLFVSENTFNRWTWPFLFTSRSWNTLFGKPVGNHIRCGSFKKLTIDVPDNLCLLRYNFRHTVFSFAVTEKMLIR